jgi:hypothetical protein
MDIIRGGRLHSTSKASDKTGLAVSLAELKRDNYFETVSLSLGLCKS